MDTMANPFDCLHFCPSVKRTALCYALRIRRFRIILINSFKIFFPKMGYKNGLPLIFMSIIDNF